MRLGPRSRLAPPAEEILAPPVEESRRAARETTASRRPWRNRVAPLEEPPRRYGALVSALRVAASSALVTEEPSGGDDSADLAAFGPWPAVKLADAPAAIRDGFEAVYPKETATIEFTYDGKKIKKAGWHSVEATEGANTTHVDPPSGFICLYTLLGARKKIPLFNPPIMAMHYLAKWAKKLGIKM